MASRNRNCRATSREFLHGEFSDSAGAETERRAHTHRGLSFCSPFTANETPGTMRVLRISRIDNARFLFVYLYSSNVKSNRSRRRTRRMRRCVFARGASYNRADITSARGRRARITPFTSRSFALRMHTMINAFGDTRHYLGFNLLRTNRK